MIIKTRKCWGFNFSHQGFILSTLQRWQDCCIVHTIHNFDILEEEWLENTHHNHKKNRIVHHILIILICSTNNFHRWHSTNIHVADVDILYQSRIKENYVHWHLLISRSGQSWMMKTWRMNFMEMFYTWQQRQVTDLVDATKYIYKIVFKTTSDQYFEFNCNSHLPK